MKTLVLLLAFVAAASAAVYVQPHCGYTYYNLKTYWIFPSSACFKFRVYYCGAWFSTKYYSPIMKVYPGPTCGEPGFVEMSLEDFTADCEGKLKTRADEILAEMKAYFTQWASDLDTTATKAKERHSSAVIAYTERFLEYETDPARREEIIAQRDENIRLYNEKIDQMVADAKAAYCDAITKMHEKIVEFHKRIIEAAVHCFNTRLAKIAEYKKNLEERIDEYTLNFKLAMMKSNEKKVDAYRCLLHRIHGSETFAQDKVEAVLELYNENLFGECLVKAGEYHEYLLSFKEKLIQRYTCSYQCATYSGCLNFAKKTYYSYCTSLGNWWCYSYSTKIPCFRFTFYKKPVWRGATYRCLRTCNLETLNKSVDDFEAEIRAQAKVATDAAQAAFDAWKVKWTDIHGEYLTKYTDIVCERHRLLIESMRAYYLCRYGELSEEVLAKIAEYEQCLATKKTTVLDEYKKCLDERYAAGCTKYQASLDRYKDCVNQLVEKVVGYYRTCMETRTKKITDYVTCLNEKRDETRQAFLDKLQAIVQKQCDEYLKMLTFYHGSITDDRVVALASCYKAKAVADCNAILDAFDAYWLDIIPKLETHYACGYKCNASVKFGVPRYSCPVSWHVCYPTSSCYTYKYKYYTTHCYYTIKNIGGCYYWTK